jgi:hypothetical protein
MTEPNPDIRVPAFDPVRLGPEGPLRTWRALEGGYARVRFWVGLIVSFALVVAGMSAGAFLFWIWRELR